MQFSAVLDITAVPTLHASLRNNFLCFFKRQVRYWRIVLLRCLEINSEIFIIDIITTDSFVKQCNYNKPWIVSINITVRISFKWRNRRNPFTCFLLCNTQHSSHIQFMLVEMCCNNMPLNFSRYHFRTLAIEKFGNFHFMESVKFSTWLPEYDWFVVKCCLKRKEIPLAQWTRRRVTDGCFSSW